jgi:hypothetical protein
VAHPGKFARPPRCPDPRPREGWHRRRPAPQACTAFFKLVARLAEQSAAAEQTA